jgi:Xaa-Pro aminopeptidase
MPQRVPVSELESRMECFRNQMNTAHPEWEFAIIISKINQFYFTGTMQEGLLVIPRNEQATLFVRRSYERAVNESYFAQIQSIDSYRDAASHYSSIPSTVYLETEFVPMAMYQRIAKYFPFKQVFALDSDVAVVRSQKSLWELAIMEQSGKIHQHVLEDLVPGLLREGMSELELAMQLYSVMVSEGHHGVARFSMFDTEMAVGHIAFGESSIYPTYFNGPGGNLGMSPAVPILGNRERKLTRGDLVFIDVGCGVNGYHTDKTMTYLFGASLPQEALEAHYKCIEIQNTIAAMLVPEAIPAQIYEHVMGSLSEAFLENFMGFADRRVKFLGHGIGLTIDEYPVIAKGFDQPLKENMVLALEPKKGIAGIGMVGIENTFVVTPQGGRCLTGNNKGLLSV